jgi:demethylmenaquinone methyltransferase / 2-methoxy-6-polyprenyl-1,4-benzoquinol methylase
LLSFKYEINNRNPEKKKRFVRKLFDTITPTYDLLNHVLSLGIDILWRKRIFKYIPDVKDMLSIDLCCGTGDLSLLFHKHGSSLVSLDFSLNMIQRGLQKNSLPGHIIAADACLLPFRDKIFNIASIAFGIRNIPDLGNFIKEAERVLKPDGKLVILELIRPAGRIIRGLYSVYLNRILPVLGGLLSGKPGAYKYLSTTITSFIDPEELQKMLEKSGFKSVVHHPQTFGIATIIVASKENG